MRGQTYTTGPIADHALSDDGTWFCWECGGPADVYIHATRRDFPWIWFACTPCTNNKGWVVHTITPLVRKPKALTIEVVIK